MDLLHIYTVWLTLFSVSFTFFPLFMVLDWRKRGTAEGFSSVNFVLPLLVMSCWMRHGLMTNDPVNIYLNAFNLVVFSSYLLAFAFYQPKRKYLYGQLLSLALTLFALFYYVDTHPDHEKADVMGSVAAGGQIISLAGGIYDIKRAISLKTTEYIPASIQFGIFALSAQWTLFGVLIGNPYMVVANLAGLSLNVITIALYTVYPPKTWRVPLLNVGGADAPKKKKQ